MNRVLTITALALIGLSAAAPTVAAQSSAAPAADHTAPSYDMKAQSLGDLERAQQKFVELAKVVPADKLTWRPSADSRSFAEVFLHVAGERYGILGMMGVAPPAGFDGKTFEKSTTDRDRIVTELNQSWEFTKKTINAMSNSDFAKLLPALGPQANDGDVVYILVADAHEHLGQAVAYARVNGIVPPWTAEAQAKAAAKKDYKK
jgi:hypothetical protein